MTQETQGTMGTHPTQQTWDASGRAIDVATSRVMCDAKHRHTYADCILQGDAYVCPDCGGNVGFTRARYLDVPTSPAQESDDDASIPEDAQDMRALDADTDAQESDDDDDASPQDAQESARRSYKERGTILPVRDAHVMTYDRATDFYRKDRDARSLATRDLGTRVLFHVRDARDATRDHLIIATCVAFSLDSVTLEQGGTRHEFPMSRIIGIRRARLEDARELRAIRRETRAQERRAQKGQDAQTTRVRTSVVTTSVADVL